MHTTRTAYRRTKQTALAVVAVAAAVALATEPGGASSTGTAPFSNGTGNATALGYKVNPTNGNLSFGITFGESIAGHQNTAATGQSRAINLGVIGTTMAGQACDGGPPTYAEKDQPQPVIARSGEKGADQGQTATEFGGIRKFARANGDPFAEAITTIAPMGDPATVFISGGRTITHSGVVEGPTREALARTELGSVSLGGGAVELRNLTWEAINRTGAVNESVGSFNIGSVFVGGQLQKLPGDGLQQAAALNDLLKPLGFAVTAPKIRTEQGIEFVDPLKIGVVPSQQRDAVTGGVLSGAQPIRNQIADALLKQDCGNATYITVADIVLGSVTGAGALGLELGGVQATTADFKQFQFGLPPVLPPVANLPDLSSTVGASSPVYQPGITPAATPPAAAPQTHATTEHHPTQPIAGFAGERGGLMALVGGGGLMTLLATAEADRRKMRHALREIPLES